MESSLSFESYLKELWRRKISIVAIPFGVAVLTAVVSLLMPKTYEATAQLIVLPPQYKPELASKTPEVKTCQFLLRSPRVLLGLRKLLVEGRQVLNELTAGEPLDQDWIEGLKDYTPQAIMRQTANGPRLDQWIKGLEGYTSYTLLIEAKGLQGHTSYTIQIRTGCSPEVARFLADLDDVGLRGLADYDLEDLQEMSIEDLEESLNAVVSEEKKTAIDVIYSPVILLRARGRTGPQAAMLANAWGEVFLQVYGGLVREVLVGSHQFIAEEAGRFEEKRAAQQEKIRRLRGEYDLDFLAARIEGTTEDFRELESELTQQRLDLDYETSRLVSLDCILTAIEDNGVWIGSTTATIRATKAGIAGREQTMREQVLASAGRLCQAQEELEAFRAQHDLATLSKEHERAVFDLTDFQSQLKRETLGVEQTAKSLEAVSQRLARTSPTLNLSRRYSTGTQWAEIPNPAWQELEYKRVELEAQLARNRTAVAMLGPYVQDLATTIATTSARLSRLETQHTRLQRNLEFAQDEHDAYRQKYIQLKRDRYEAAQAIGPLRSRVGQLEATIQNVHALIDEAQTSLTAGQTKLGQLQIEDQTLERYLTLTLEKLQEARLAIAQQGLDVKVASEAIAPSRKIWPQRTLMVFVMTFLGFFFAVAFVCVRLFMVTAGVWTSDGSGRSA